MKLKMYIILQLLLLEILFAVLLTGCNSQYPIVSNVRDSVRIEERTRVDSIYRDRWHTTYMRGDTVFVRDSIYLDRWHIDRRTDSVFVRDTLRERIEVQVNVPVRQRNGYDRFTARGFWLFVILLLLRIAWVVVKRFYLKR